MSDQPQTLSSIQPVHAESKHWPGILALYNYYVENTAITFDIETYTLEQRQPWFEQFAPHSRHQLFVINEGDELLGYAGSMPFRPKAAYHPSVELTIYLQPGRYQSGLGSKLLAHLLNALADQDVHRMYSAITLPNDPSIRLHQRFGFTEVGTMNEVGRKFGRFHDVLWMEKKLNPLGT